MNVTRLAAQVLKLRQQGHNITAEIVKSGQVRFARYHL